MRKAEEDQIGATERTAAEALAELRVRGMEVHEQTAAEAEAWRAAIRPPVVEAFLRQSPDGGQRVLGLLGAL